MIVVVQADLLSAFCLLIGYHQHPFRQNDRYFLHYQHQLRLVAILKYVINYIRLLILNYSSTSSRIDAVPF